MSVYWLWIQISNVNLYGEYIMIYNVGSWLVCAPPPPLNYIWTLFKVAKQQKIFPKEKHILD